MKRREDRRPRGRDGTRPCGQGPHPRRGVPRGAPAQYAQAESRLPDWWRLAALPGGAASGRGGVPAPGGHALPTGGISPPSYRRVPPGHRERPRRCGAEGAHAAPAGQPLLRDRALWRGGRANTTIYRADLRQAEAAAGRPARWRGWVCRSPGPGSGTGGEATREDPSGWTTYRRAESGAAKPPCAAYPGSALRRGAAVQSWGWPFELQDHAGKDGPRPWPCTWKAWHRGPPSPSGYRQSARLPGRPGSTMAASDHAGAAADQYRTGRSRSWRDQAGRGMMARFELGIVERDAGRNSGGGPDGAYREGGKGSGALRPLTPGGRAVSWCRTESTYRRGDPRAARRGWRRRDRPRRRRRPCCTTCSASAHPCNWGSTRTP